MCLGVRWKESEEGQRGAEREDSTRNSRENNKETKDKLTYSLTDLTLTNKRFN